MRPATTSTASEPRKQSLWDLRWTRRRFTVTEDLRWEMRPLHIDEEWTDLLAAPCAETEAKGEIKRKLRNVVQVSPAGSQYR